jgi:tripartite-type tricarboxylate transporter receptor subunit TctC
VSAPPSVGRPIFSTPNVPADRVQVLRAAFDATMKDPAFLEEAKKLGLDINPISGVDLEKIVSDIIDTPKPVRDRLAAILSLIDRK